MSELAECVTVFILSVSFLDEGYMQNTKYSSKVTSDFFWHFCPLKKKTNVNLEPQNLQCRELLVPRLSCKVYVSNWHRRKFGSVRHPPARPRYEKGHGPARVNPRRAGGLCFSCRAWRGRCFAAVSANRKSVKSNDGKISVKDKVKSPEVTKGEILPFSTIF